MSELTLSAAEVASLLMLDVAILEVIEGTYTPDTIEELKALHADLNGILFKKESSLNYTA